MKKSFYRCGTDLLKNMGAEPDAIESEENPEVWSIIKESLSNFDNRYIMLFFDSQLTKSLFLDLISR